MTVFVVGTSDEPFNQNGWPGASPIGVSPLRHHRLRRWAAPPLHRTGRLSV